MRKELSIVYAHISALFIVPSSFLVVPNAFSLPFSLKSLSELIFQSRTPVTNYYPFHFLHQLPSYFPFILEGQFHLI